MLLTPHFSLEEMTKTSTGLANEPNPEQLAHLRVTAEGMEQVRDYLGHPVDVDSGFRSEAVNLKVRGVRTSAHCMGWACDFVCPAYGSPWAVAEVISRSPIKFDQLILEYGWVHISFDPRMRGQKLTKRSADAPYEIGLNA